MPLGENVPQLAGAPQRMLATERAEQFHELGVDAVGAVVRRPTAIVQSAPSFLLKTREPFVADPPAHAVAGTQLSRGEAVTPRVVDERQALLHRGCLQPGHRPASPSRERPCSLEGVIPMLPDTGVTYVPGLYPEGA